MKTVTRYQSEDGQLYMDKGEAEKADVLHDLRKNYLSISPLHYEDGTLVEFSTFLAWAKRNESFVNETLAVIRTV